MAVIAKQRYKLDIAPRGGWVIVYASRHDDGAREIEFEITNQGRAFSIPASINVSVQGIKSNGSYFSHSCSYSGNIVTMALADDMTDITGKSICVLKFTNSSQQKLATAKFVLNVDTDSSSEGIIIDTDAEEIFNQMLNEIRAQASAISADIAGLQLMVGTPLVASAASGMTDHNKIYVYTGSESGYINGNWYYWNGSAWASGGVYNSTAFETDKTLSVENMAADAFRTGIEINLTREKTKNVFNPVWLLANGITITDGVIFGVLNNFYTAFKEANGGISLNCKENTQYTFSGKVKNNGLTSATGNGFLFRIYYTDESYTQIAFNNSWTDFHDFVATTDANKTIDHISISYGGAGGNTWFLKELQLEEGTSKTDFVGFYSSIDSVARDDASGAVEIAENSYNVADILRGQLQLKLVWENGTINTSGKNQTSSANMRTGDIVCVKKGSKISKTLNNIALMVVRYSHNDINSFLNTQQILPLAKMDDYVFTEDTYCRFVLQNPNSLARSPSWANDVIKADLYDANFAYNEIGVAISILGFPSYLGNGIVFKLPNGIAFGIDSYLLAAYNSVKAIYAGIGVSHFDYFMITHYHQDHVGNIINLINDGYIDEDTIMILPPDLDTSYETPIFTDWLDENGPKNMYLAVKPAIINCGCEIIYPTEGQTISIAGVDFKFFNCDHSVYYPGGNYRSTNFNDLSIGCYVSVGNYNFCDTADLGPIGQQRMVDLGTMKKANLYTATHHGWDNGNAQNYYGLIPAWINRLSPDVVFSEDYSGHDSHIMSKSAPMQSWCEANGVPNYRSRVNGTMYLQLNKYGWKFKGNYSRFIRNNKNWSYSDNSEHVED